MGGARQPFGRKPEGESAPLLLFALGVFAGFGEPASGFAGFRDATSQAVFFFCYGFGVDEPLAVAGAAGLFLLGAGEAAEAQEATNFGAGRVHHDGGLLSGEPVGEALRHLLVTLAVGIFAFNSTDWDFYTVCKIRVT